MSFLAADSTVSLEDAEALLLEIERLRAEVSRLELRVSELDQLAHQDSLVDLPNRRCFLDRLDHLIARVERYDDKAAMVFADVDSLKLINDQFGHNAGDAALVEVARLLHASVRKSDCVARLGGDEFGVLLERTDEITAWNMALRIVEKVVGVHFCVDGCCLPLSIAVGVTVIKVGDDPRSVMDRADQAMYRLKNT